MKKISLIAAVDENFGLGKDNQLLCHLPADLKHFKQLTIGKPIIMGRKTFLSIGRPLPERQNIVLTSQSEPIAGVEIARSLTDAFLLATAVPEIMIIGGERVFREALPFASTIYLTIIHHQFAADVFFPELDASIWISENTIDRPADEKNPFALTFIQYQRRSNPSF
ncbi:MAG: dihydrofolate reductase [Legionella sp.]|nr:dihydrofolate reductase [Legionella sp.]